MANENPLLDDRTVDFLLYDVFDAPALCALPAFADHSRDTFELYLGMTRKVARNVLYPSYRAMDGEPAHFNGKGVQTHPRMRDIYPQLVDLGVINATRPADVDGQQLPSTVATVANMYLMAGNLSAYGFAMLTSGAAHLIEAFGTPELKRDYMQPMYAGKWTGTMALTEPQAGSSLADVQTRATPTAAGHYLIHGSKVFISGGDQDFTDNIVHLALARIDGAPAGTRGISLFAIPKMRLQDGSLVDNDAVCAGAFHKLGWRGIPSVALNFGERGDCHGYLVGEPHRGLSYMFQMMNEARLSIGANGVATAAVAFHESLQYAKDRPQGRKLGAPQDSPPVAIIEHADVRRMLLRQKAIVEGAMSLMVATARYADLSVHAATEAERTHADVMLNLLTPVAKTFPAEKGYESNVLAVQIHGGYGYTSEYLPEAWLRDQKLNSIHEGTTGIQSADLLGRKLGKNGHASMTALHQEVNATLERARAVGVDAVLCNALEQSLARVTGALIKVTAEPDFERLLSHSVDFMDLFSTFVIGWQWLVQLAAAQPKLSSAPDDFLRGKLACAQYWFRTELPRIEHLASLCESFDDSYLNAQPAWF